MAGDVAVLVYLLLVLQLQHHRYTPYLAGSGKSICSELCSPVLWRAQSVLFGIFANFADFV